MSLVADALDATDRQTAATKRARSHSLPSSVVAGEDWDSRSRSSTRSARSSSTLSRKVRWPSVVHEPLILKDGGEVIGGCLVMIQRLPLGLGSVAIAKWGPIFAKARSAGRLDLYKRDDRCAGRGVRRQAAADDFDLAQCRRLGGRNAQYETLIASGFKEGAGLLFPNRYIVNLRLSDAEQRKSLHQKWRYHLNKADKAGLTFEDGGAERLAEFDLLYNAMTDRKKFADHSAYHTVPSLMAAADPGAPAASCSSSATRASSSPARSSSPRATGRSISTARPTTKRCRFGPATSCTGTSSAGCAITLAPTGYDLGGTDGFQGLHQFKKGMVGDAGVITPVPPVANYAAYRLPFLIGTHRVCRARPRARASVAGSRASAPIRPSATSHVMQHKGEEA